MKVRYISMVALVAVVVFTSGAGAQLLGPVIANVTVGSGTGALPTWDKVIPGPGRFQVLSQFNNEAVLDKETGLVWERSPDTGARQWFAASHECIKKVVGNRKGWRLPTIQELLSLLLPGNPANTSSPRLPPGHPFSNLQAQDSEDVYWSGTPNTDFDSSNPIQVWAVHLGFSAAFPIAKDGALYHTWCVRSGHGGPEVQ